MHRTVAFEARVAVGEPAAVDQESKSCVGIHARPVAACALLANHPGTRRAIEWAWNGKALDVPDWRTADAVSPASGAAMQ